MAIVNSSRFNFKDNIEDMMRDYYRSVELGVIEATYEVIPQVAKEAAQKLRRTSPRSNGKSSGKYAKGWTSKVEKGRTSVGAVVYGKDGTYQLAHLLEHGHAKRNGGRTAAMEHIKPVEEWAINEAYDRIMKKVEMI